MGHRLVVAIVSFAACTLLAPRLVSAQAWVPAKGEGTVPVFYQNTAVKDHFFSRGQYVDRGEIQSALRWRM